MEIEVGMYVRTKIGIAKITDIICGQDVKFDNDNFLEEDEKIHHQNDGISKYDNYFWKEEVTKCPSRNIIDLIEVGDYVNGHKVISVNTTFTYTSVNVETSGEATCEVIPLKNIESILTKEQFEREAYKI